MGEETQIKNFSEEMMQLCPSRHSVSVGDEMPLGALPPPKRKLTESMELASIGKGKGNAQGASSSNGKGIGESL